MSAHWYVLLLPLSFIIIINTLQLILYSMLQARKRSQLATVFNQPISILQTIVTCQLYYILQEKKIIASRTKYDIL